MLYGPVNCDVAALVGLYVLPGREAINSSFVAISYGPTNCDVAAMVGLNVPGAKRISRSVCRSNGPTNCMGL